MTENNKGAGRRSPGKNVFTTKSGNVIKLHRSLGERIRAKRESKIRKRAAYLSSLPRNPFKRLLYRLHPKRQLQYWFSRQGLLMVLKLTGVGIVAGFLLMVGIFAYFRKDLPNITDLSGNNLGGSITYYDRTGKIVLWQDYDAVKRVQVSGDNISQFMKDATVAIEDKNFYKHGAFDVQGIMRAGFRDLTNRDGRVEGGSTITQQVVKLNQNWTRDRTLARKFKELILAVELEREYSKQDILTGYLNTAPYGNIQYGVETATRDYFNKSAKELTLAEAAMLAAIPQAPSHYSPYGPYYDADDLIGRQQYIIDQMLKQKMITKAQADEAKGFNILATIRPVQPKYGGIKAPYFVLAAKSELEQKYGDKTVQRGGWQVTTTLDMRLQELAENQVSKGIAQVIKQGGDVAAFAAIDVHTAQMVALVGGPDFSNPTYGQVNFAREWLPPGSSFKPYDYVALLNETTNTGAGSVLYDNEAPLPGWPCTDKRRPKDGGNCLNDYDFRYPGPVTVRYALGGSRNVPAVKAMLTAGVNKTISIAESMGLVSGYNCYDDELFASETQCYGSSAIGDGAYLHLDEHVNGYATLSRLGNYLPQTYILKITNSRGKTIDEWKAPKAKQVVKTDAAYIVTNILTDPNASYLSQPRKFHRYKGWEFAIKTGTTNDAKDGLMMSFSTKYAAGVWVGYHNRQRAMSGFMENMTQPIIQGWMYGAHDPITPVNWTKPATVQTLPAFVIRNKISSNSERVPSPDNDLYPSWYKQTNKTGGTQTRDRVSGKLATSCTPDLARDEQTNANATRFSADIFVDAKTEGSDTDDIHQCSDEKPIVTLTPSGGDNCKYSCVFTLTYSQGTHPISSEAFPGTLELYVNGSLVQSQTVTAAFDSRSFDYTPTINGTVEVEARIIDSVLYSDSNTAQVTLTASPSGGGGP